jgi:HAE1 family hydrophobic/amphiphilic exporter-1
VQAVPQKPHGDGSGGSAFIKATERWFDSLLRGYDRTLQIVLRHRPATMMASLVVLALTALLFVLVPKGFIPDQDTDQIAVTTEAAQGTSYPKLVEYQSAVADIIRQDPNVEGLVSTIGGSAARRPAGPTRTDRGPPEAPGHRRSRSHIIAAAPQIARIPASRSICRTRRRSGSADRSARACISTRCNRPIARNCTPRRAS